MEKLHEIIQKNERKNFPFVPDKDFYNVVQINAKRWAKIYRNEVSPTLDEAKRIADFFNVEITELI
ncbi:MAG TPA: hypothetical protein DEA97_14300 [Bacteroidales bacterium]|nr:MAG: hypothetical protein UR43_C0011G0027 [candidate division TM6 bacterium GW2011_GWF2_33_332]HBS87730.1 hypothetical protein [Bacteroidales bacterium]